MPANQHPGMADYIVKFVEDMQDLGYVKYRGSVGICGGYVGSGICGIYVESVEHM